MTEQTTTPDLVDDLFAYNDWGNQKILSLCDGLTDEQLDTPREMGFGTLRATLFHILTAEIIWMERWQSVPWRKFPTDPDSMSVAKISEALADVATRRRDLIAAGRDGRWQQRIAYQDSKQTPYDHVLIDLLLHVANHGTHHRAQSLNYLKQFDRTIVAGIDYIFYRLANFSVEQTSEAVKGLTDYGLAVSEPNDHPCPYDATIGKRFYEYHDWAIGKVLKFAKDLDAPSLDRDFNMGPGSLRKTLLHLFDAESWWVGNWTTGPCPFPESPADTTIAELSEQWSDLAHRRNAYIAGVNETESQRIVEIQAGGPPTRFKVGESIIHVAIHGTHHRAQIINMLRQVETPLANIDLLYSIGELS